ncbi:MAG: hypothetical protein ACYS26_14030 [Planctomycetota bacterium]|jgi:hypothetical protein
MRFALPLTLPLAVSFQASADTLVVPDDAINLTAAIAIAQPGDTILVRTTLDQNGLGPVFVDKSLTVRGEPVCNFDLGAPALILAGPGGARLELENVVMGYGFTDSEARPSLSGTGFEEVVLKGCEILHDNFAGSGLITLTEPAVDLPGVERLILLDSELLGSPAGADGCVINLSFYADGEPGIYAPAAEVILLASDVVGGRGGQVETTVQPCPNDIAEWPGKGGVAVVAANVSQTQSTTSGGQGALWRSQVLGLCDVGQSVVCGFQPQAAAFDVSGSVVDRELSLLASPPSVSLSGGTQVLDLVAEPQFAGGLYFVAGSFSGTTPGLPLGSLTVPLATPDPYFDFSIANFNGAVLGATLGTLDGNGRAQATVTLNPALSTNLIGVSATHACVVFDGALAPAAVSNPTELEIVP